MYLHISVKYHELRGSVIGEQDTRLDLEAKEAACSELGRQNLTQLVARNTLVRGDDQHYPNWLDPGFAAAPAQVEALSALPIIELAFCVDCEGFRSTANPIDLIFDALGLARHNS